MTKLLSLLAVVGLLASPAFAIEGEKVAPATHTGDKKMEAAAVDCSKAADIKKCEADAKIAADKAASEAAKTAPAAGEVKKEEKRM